MREAEGRGWAVVAGLAAVLCVIFGVTMNSFGVFLLPIGAEFGSGSEETSRVVMVFVLCMNLSMPAAGWLLDRVRPRPVMVAGALLTALGCGLGAESGSIGRLSAAMALGGIGVGASTYVPGVVVASRWIERSRQGLAFGVLLGGASLGAVIFPVLLTEVIARLGWRAGMRASAAGILLLCLPLLAWAARLPAAPVEAPAATSASGHDLGPALRMPRYWLWVAIQVLITPSCLGIYFHIVPYLSSVGYSAQRAAGCFGATGAAAMAGFLVFGVVTRRWGAQRTLIFGTLMSSVGILVLLLASERSVGLPAAIAFVLLWGGTFNLINQLAPVLLVEAMGERNFGSLLGFGSFVAGLLSSLGPTLTGMVYDATKSYALAFELCALGMALALVPIALLHRRRAVAIR
jgi:predicted MFS family arabinose efflux permease